MKEIKLTIHPFEMDSLKEAAKKIQEEAGEAFVEFLLLYEGQSKDTTRLEDELSDCIQACCNMLMRYGADSQAAMERCERRNRERGRYEDEDAKPCGIHDGNDCNCGRGRANASAGMGVLREKSPEEMSVEELIEALYIANGGSYYRNNSCSCTKKFGSEWCRDCGNCTNCREHLLDLLKVAYESKAEEAIGLIKDGGDEYMRLRTENGIMLDELLIRQDRMDKLERQVADLTHERDGLLRRLDELSDAGIAELHRLLRETLGEAKNVTHNARVYIGKRQGSNNERCGDCGTDSGCDSCDCGVERAREHLLSEEPPTQEMSEREVVIERLRKIDFAQGKVTLYRIAVAILGDEPSPAPWWSNESHAELRDKLIELLSTPGWDYCKTCELVKSDDGE